MKDPYQVLGLPRDAGDELVKKTYRNLARKYHPDNYLDSALADMAQEKMKAINAAYEQIRRERGLRGTGGGRGQRPGPGGRQAHPAGAAGARNAGPAGPAGAGYRRTSPPPPPGSAKALLYQVRLTILNGNLNLAEALLASCEQRTAEWYFLRGAIAYRRGWMDEATQNYQTACRLDPEDAEYRRALAYMEHGPGRAYSPGRDFGTEVFRCGYRAMKVGACLCCGYQWFLVDTALRTYTNDTLGTLLCGNFFSF